MFTTLYFREWKEKALIFFFELGILAVLFAAQFILREKKDIREWLIYAVLLLFYPFAALVLGAAGFEAEYRQGAWAYLFSRPVGKATVWLAKFAALLSMLVALWLVFVVLWIAVPGLRELVGGTRVLLGFRVASEFPWWSILASAFLLVVAFSLSLLHERQFNILFLALLVGFFVPAAAWAVMNAWPGGFMAWLEPERILPTFLVCQVLVALAFGAASILALVRSDFSQPRKLTLGFLRWFAAFLVLALAGTAVSPGLMPVKGDRYLYLFTSTAGEPYYVTERGVFRYSATKHRIQWMAKGKGIDYWAATASDGRIAYLDFDIRSKNDIVRELWVVNADGSGRKKVFGRGTRETELTQMYEIRDLLISPEGARVAILSRSANDQPRGKRLPPLWIATTDGTRLESLPDDPALFESPAGRFYFHLVAWARDGNAILVAKVRYGQAGRQADCSLWIFDLGSGTAKLVLDNAVPASWGAPVLDQGGRLTIKCLKSPEAPWRLALLDLKTLAITEVVKGGPEDRGLVISQISGDPAGSRIAYICRQKQAGGPDAYILVVYSLAQQKVLAERRMTTSESAAQVYCPSWTADNGKIVVLDREADGLKIFGPDLKEIEQIAFPLRLSTPVSLWVAGNHALVEDNNSNSLWRCDLVKKTWKRLY
jgi:hypothetical protein